MPFHSTRAKLVLSTEVAPALYVYREVQVGTMPFPEGSGEWEQSSREDRPVSHFPFQARLLQAPRGALGAGPEILENSRKPV